MGADVYMDGIRSMADDAIVFAMANPTPEVEPEEIEELVAAFGTGRSDYPNQINNPCVGEPRKGTLVGDRRGTG